MILVDTSVWIDLFSKKPFKNSPAEADLQHFVTCAPVIQEVLQGIRMENAYHEIRESLISLPILGNPLPLKTYLHASDLYRSGRRRGLSIRSSIDCLISAIALEYGASIWHRDRDFNEIAKYSELKLYSPK